MKNLRISTTTRQPRALLFAIGLCLLLSSCRRRQVIPTLPPVLQTPDVQPPAPKAPAMHSPPPDSVTHAPSVKVTVTKPPKRPRRSAPKTVVAAPPAPVETATAVPLPAPVPPLSIVGALTTGGDVSPKAQQETTDLIATDERRLQALAKTNAREQQTQLKEVRHFLDQAKEVLSSGDAEGARTLATKAKLLLDDLEK